VLPDRDGEIIDTRPSPIQLDYDRVLMPHPHNRWQVAVRYENPHQFSVVAEVDLAGEFQHYGPAIAVAEVLEELAERYWLGEFDYPEIWVDARAITIGGE
jgi:hypothetical protein